MRPHICFSANLSVLPPQHVQRFCRHVKLHIQLLLGMWCTLHGIAVPVVNGQHLCRRTAAIRLHHLNGLPHRELVALLRADTACRAMSVCRFDLSHQSQVGVTFVIRVAVVDLAPLVRSSEIEAGVEFPVCTAAYLFPIPGNILSPQFF